LDERVCNDEYDKDSITIGRAGRKRAKELCGTRTVGIEVWHPVSNRINDGCMVSLGDERIVSLGMKAQQIKLILHDTPTSQKFP
jgi:hypothetical protein